LANSTFGRELAAHHLGALGVHHLRVGRGFARHREKAVRVEPQALGKNEALGKREAIEPEDEIDRELGTASVADLAHVKMPGRDCFDDLGHLLQLLGGAAE
jgi:hypothetical protein